MAFIFILILSFPFFYYFFVNLIFSNRIYPNVSVAGINLGGFKKVDAEINLKDNCPTPKSIRFSKDGTTLKIDLVIKPSDIIAQPILQSTPSSSLTTFPQ